MLRVVVAVLTVTASGILAQEEAAVEAETDYFEEIAVDIVNVEAYVTDGDGNPVQGLTIDDFEILEDGRGVELVNFYSVFDGRPAVPEPSAPETQPEEPAARREAEPVLPEYQKLHLIVYVDNLFIHPLNRKRVFDNLRSFIYRTLKPGDEVSVASYDRSLHIRQPFTSDPRKVAEALGELEQVNAWASTREQERSDALKKIYETRSVHKALFEASSFADNTQQQANESLDGLREMLESLAGLPGRKMMIHVSDGLPTVPGQDLYQAVQQHFSDQSALFEAMSYDLSQRYIQLIALANSNRVSFYTVDAAGLRTQSGMGAENPSINVATGVNFAVDAVRTSNLQDTLIMMADRTGGQAVFNTNDVSEGLDRFAKDFNNYYSLGYRAPLVNRGRFHDIEVRLKQPQKGWRVRHREGYRDKTVEAQIEDAVNSFFVHNYQTNPLGAEIDFGPQAADEDGNYEVAIRVRVPLEHVTLVPRPEFHQGQLRLYFSATDDKGKRSPLGEMPLELRIPNESVEMARQDEVARVINLTMRPGPHKLVIGVRDEISEQRSIIGRFLNVAVP